MDSIIRIDDVTRIFGKGPDAVTALQHVNLAVRRGEFAVLIGPSGCGKSTLLYMIAGFDAPTEGVISLDGEPIRRPAPDRGFVFQDYALFPWRTVLGNVMFGLQHATSMGRHEAKARAMQFIQLVNLSGFENAYPHTLSGGMKQRVGIARALAYDPKVLLMDEPFGALDAQTRKLMQHEMAEIWRSTQKTVVFVTHSVIEAVYLADRIIVMTARPGTVKGCIDVSVPRPRAYTEEHYLDVRRDVLALLEEEVERSSEATDIIPSHRS
ncbi:MAG: ABC transporter ATP-binding protein [Candidatus Bipolaricaulia bacterium]